MRRVVGEDAGAAGAFEGGEGFEDKGVAVYGEPGAGVVVGVSCNPQTFARDARTLIDAGFVLERVTPVDQFLWSAHVELVGVFKR